MADNHFYGNVIFNNNDGQQIETKKVDKKEGLWKRFCNFLFKDEIGKKIAWGIIRLILKQFGIDL